MIKGIDHVAIAVENLDDMLALFENVLGFEAKNRERIEDYKVEVATIDVGNTCIELVQGIAPDSPISNFIAKRGPGIHHIALEVDDIDATARDGKDDSRVAFIHPRSTGRILFELVQNKSR